MKHRPRLHASHVIVAVSLTVLGFASAAQDAASPTPPASEKTAPTLSSMAWLEGCWQGSVSKREFREVWLPQRGAMMVGVSQTIEADKTVDYEYMRLENRGDAAYYVVALPGKPESAFRLTEEVVDATDGAHTFVFLDATATFPRRIAYRRASAGWLYAEVEGTVNGAPRKLIYPMRRIDCASGEVIAK